MKKSEENFYILGAQYFGKDYFSLSNKSEYKQEFYLNTGLSMFRKKNKILIFTSCISETNYLYKVITKEVYDVTIYYFNSNVDIAELEDYYFNSNVKFIKIKNNPKNEFSNINHLHNTIVFASDDTIIFDSKELGDEGSNSENNRNVYRDKSIEHYNLYLKRAMNLI